MAPTRSAPPRQRPPLLLVLVGSLLIVFHLGSVAVNTLAASSGPWPTPQGVELAPSPYLPRLVQEQVALPYLSALRMSHNYHYPSNRVNTPEADLEVRLLDESGKLMKTVRFPDAKAHMAVRLRQHLLARSLGDDQPVQPVQGEKIPAPTQKVPAVPIWGPVPDEPRQVVLSWVPENLLPRDRPLLRPSEWSLLVVRSCARHLCRVHGAASAEVVRHSRDPIRPRILFERELPPDIGPLLSIYGRLPR